MSKKPKETMMDYAETTYYNMKDIREVIDIVIGDDGFRSKEALEILDLHYKHVHFPIMIDVKCKVNHNEEE